MTSRLTVRRGFADTSIGQRHYRYCGSGPVLVMCHGSPGSAKQLEPFMHILGRHFTVIAPDTPGNGDSVPLPLAQPTIEDFAVAQIEFLDVMGIEDVAAVYGSHTGAGIAAEMAIRDSKRIRKVVQDGSPIFTKEQREDYLRDYAHPFMPDLDGAYLLRGFMFCRDQYLFFPWYKRDKEHRRDCALPSAEWLHDWVMEVMKSATTYHRSYRAAFAYLAEERLPLVTQPILCLGAEDDPLCAATREAALAHSNATYLDMPRYDDAQYVDRLTGSIIAFV